jgi:hypothetical protein
VPGDLLKESADGYLVPLFEPVSERLSGPPGKFYRVGQLHVVLPFVIVELRDWVWARMGVIPGGVAGKPVAAVPAATAAPFCLVRPHLLYQAIVHVLFAVHYLRFAQQRQVGVRVKPSGQVLIPEPGGPPDGSGDPDEPVLLCCA